LKQALLALDGDWTRPAGSGEWSTHDLLAHLSSSQSALVRVIKAEPPPAVAATEPAKLRDPFDSDRWNASQIRKRLEIPTEELHQEFERASEELEGLLADADLEREVAVGAYGGGTLSGYLDFMLRHQQEHVEELRQALA
jgi:uncharacterized damage-inducible protein DinB